MDRSLKEAEAVNLGIYLRAVGEELVAGAGRSRSVLVNVDDFMVPARVAGVIAGIVRDMVVNGFAMAVTNGAPTVEIACGANPDGGIALAISYERAGADAARDQTLRRLGTPLVSRLVS